MKFQLAINLERLDDGDDMRDVAAHTLEMVQMADCGGFHIVWAAEHHAIEMTIAPDPFSLKNIRIAAKGRLSLLQQQQIQFA